MSKNHILRKDIEAVKRAEKPVEYIRLKEDFVKGLTEAKIPFEKIDYMTCETDIILQSNKNKVKISFDRVGQLKKVLINNMEVHQPDKDTY